MQILTEIQIPRDLTWRRKHLRGGKKVVLLVSEVFLAKLIDQALSTMTSDNSQHCQQCWLNIVELLPNKLMIFIIRGELFQPKSFSTPSSPAPLRAATAQISASFKSDSHPSLPAGERGNGEIPYCP